MLQQNVTRYKPGIANHMHVGPLVLMKIWKHNDLLITYPLMVAKHLVISALWTESPSRGEEI